MGSPYGTSLDLVNEFGEVAGDLTPDPPKGGALALTQGLMGTGRRTIQARFQ